MRPFDPSVYARGECECTIVRVQSTHLLLSPFPSILHLDTRTNCPYQLRCGPYAHSHVVVIVVIAVVIDASH